MQAEGKLRKGNECKPPCLEDVGDGLSPGKHGTFGSRRRRRRRRRRRSLLADDAAGLAAAGQGLTLLPFPAQLQLSFSLTRASCSYEAG